MIIEKQIAKVGCHLIRHIVVQLNVRSKLELLMILELKLVVSVADAHKQFQLLLRLEFLRVEVACTVGRVKLHVLSQPEAQVLAQELFVGANERYIILRSV